MRLLPTTDFDGAFEVARKVARNANANGTMGRAFTPVMRAAICGLAVATGGFTVACHSEPERADGRSREDQVEGAAWPAAPAARGVLFVRPSLVGPVDEAVRSALSGAAASKRTLVVYVGAEWCEPCQRFRQAAERGELNREFPAVNFLEFDLDQDRERLAAAGYQSRLIPLFALPAPNGKASGKQIEGGIKGDGAVAYMVPRLREMLSE